MLQKCTSINQSINVTLDALLQVFMGNASDAAWTDSVLLWSFMWQKNETKNDVNLPDHITSSQAPKLNGGRGHDAR